MSPATEIRLDTPRGTLGGLRWHVPGGAPVLCLHGWLDNAASFLPMSKFLTQLDLVAIDFPGHGRSDHRHSSAHYYFSEYLWDMDAALDALGWSCCHLVGHSLGAAVATIYAAAAPDRVRSLVTLDALGPLTGPAEACTARLRKSLHSIRSGPRKSKSYRSIEDMIKARQAKSDLGDEPARLICERSVRQLDSHFEWSNDPALYWVSPLLMTEEQVLDCLRHIEAPVMSLTATPFGPFVTEQRIRDRCAAVPHGRHEFQPGGHHFHMDQPEPVATKVQSFILEHEQPSQEKPCRPLPQ